MEKLEFGWVLLLDLVVEKWVMGVAFICDRIGVWMSVHLAVSV